ncbi:MAG: LPP20 family lipoprotein [Pontiellaceae bacterium]|nr:LPP20 family lipoprotein [Pontiellaceae bacterium]
MRTSFKPILLLIALAFAGCKTLQEPDWLRNPKSVYPEDRYLSAIGAGSSRQTAEYAASANLSRIFKSHIEATDRLIDVTSESEKEFSRTTEVSTDINILSEQTLINIQHAEAWKDDIGRYHAIAYIDRRATAEIYQNQIDENSRRIQTFLTYADQAETLLQKHAQLRAAARLANENTALLQQLKVIHSPTAEAAAPPYSIAALKTALLTNGEKIRVSIQIDGDTNERTAEILKEMITRYGFTVGEPAVLTLQGHVSFTDTGKRTDDLLFYRFNLTVDVKDQAGRTITTITENGREAVTSTEEALPRFYRTLNKAVQQSGPRSLDAYFNSLIEQNR